MPKLVIDEAKPKNIIAEGKKIVDDIAESLGTVLYTSYEKETGKKPTYNRSGEIHETKEFTAWKDNYLSNSLDDINLNQIGESTSDNRKNEINDKILNVIVKATKTGGISLKKLSSEVDMKESDVKIHVRDLEMESKVYYSDTNIIQSYDDTQSKKESKIPNLKPNPDAQIISANDIQKSIKYFHYIEFLYDLMSKAMTFKEDYPELNDKEMETLTHIKELVEKK